MCFRRLCIVFDTENVVGSLSKVIVVKVKGHMVQVKCHVAQRSRSFVKGKDQSMFTKKGRWASLLK